MKPAKIVALVVCASLAFCLVVTIACVLLLFPSASSGPGAFKKCVLQYDEIRSTMRAALGAVAGSQSNGVELTDDCDDGTADFYASMPVSLTSPDVLAILERLRAEGWRPLDNFSLAAGGEWLHKDGRLQLRLVPDEKVGIIARVGTIGS